MTTQKSFPINTLQHRWSNGTFHDHPGREWSPGCKVLILKHFVLLVAAPRGQNGRSVPLFRGAQRPVDSLGTFLSNILLTPCPLSCYFLPSARYRVPRSVAAIPAKWNNTKGRIRKHIMAELPSKLKLLKAEALALEKVTSGKTIKDLAEEYRMTPGAVSTHLSIAEKSGIVERLEAKILERLVPRALALLEEQILRGNVKAATDVLFGVGVLSRDRKFDPVSGGLEMLAAIRTVPRPNAEIIQRHDDGAELHGEGHEEQ